MSTEREVLRLVPCNFSGREINFIMSEIKKHCQHMIMMMMMMIMIILVMMMMVVFVVLLMMIMQCYESIYPSVKSVNPPNNPFIRRKISRLRRKFSGEIFLSLIETDSLIVRHLEPGLAWDEPWMFSTGKLRCSRKWRTVAYSFIKLMVAVASGNN